MRRRLVIAAATVMGLAALPSGPVPRAFGDSGPSPTTVATPVATVPSAGQIIATARHYLGSPYASIGDDPKTGFSCIGLVHFVFAHNGVYVPEDLPVAFASAPQIAQSSLQPGDLIFFKDTAWKGLSHVALYIGDGKMIAADSFETGVEIDTLSDPYWQEHYYGATRPLADPSGTPANPLDTPVPAGPSLAPPAGPSLHVKPGAALTTRFTAAIYSGPGYGYIAIDTVPPASAVTAVQTQGQWVNVTYDGGSQYGWLAGADVGLGTVPRAPNTATAVAGAAPSASPVPPATPSPTAVSTPVTAPSAGRSSSAAPRAGLVARDDAGKTLVVAHGGATLYSGPGSLYQPLAQVGPGTVVAVLHTQDRWDQIVLPDGTEGWTEYVALRAPAGDDGASTPAARLTAAVHSSAGHIVVVTADALMVRAEPDRHAPILGRVYAGDRLRVLATARGWDRVVLPSGAGSAEGWVSARYVR